jgi:hypothetical protein
MLVLCDCPVNWTYVVVMDVVNNILYVIFLMFLFLLKSISFFLSKKMPSFCLFLFCSQNVMGKGRLSLVHINLSSNVLVWFIWVQTFTCL